MMWRGLILALAVPVAALAQDHVPEPEGYRMERYRGPVPATLKDGVVISTETAHALWHSGRVAFIDVLPRAPKPTNLPEGTIWREKPRNSIAGALWLPNVGYGAIADVTAAYFKAGLASLVGDDKNHPLVFFCLEECWMSWNAAKRALEWGHRRVFWYPDGTDGWAFYDFPQQVIDPMPGNSGAVQ